MCSARRICIHTQPVTTQAGAYTVAADAAEHSTTATRWQHAHVWVRMHTPLGRNPISRRFAAPQVPSATVETWISVETEPPTEAEAPTEADTPSEVIEVVEPVVVVPLVEPAAMQVAYRFLGTNPLFLLYWQRPSE